MIGWWHRRRWDKLCDLVLGSEENQSHDMGIAYLGGPLGWGVTRGYGKWLPMPVRRAIVAIWNLAYCWLHGHDILDERRYGGKEIVCVNCCKEFQ